MIATIAAIRYFDNRNKKGEIADRMNLEIQLMDEVKILNADSADYMSRPYKLIIHQDSKGCTSCLLNLQGWSVFSNYVNLLSLNN